jgi:hypothetical protein
MLTPPQSDVAGVVELAPSVRLFLARASTGYVTHTDGEGPEKSAQLAEYAGLCMIDAWKGKWRYALTETGLAARQMILAASQRTTGDE